MKHLINIGRILLAMLALIFISSWFIFYCYKEHLEDIENNLLFCKNTSKNIKRLRFWERTKLVFNGLFLLLINLASFEVLICLLLELK